MTEHRQDRLTALQLYFPGASRARVTNFWHHLSAPALAQHLLKVAQKAKIDQVMLKPISAGYLTGHRISHHPRSLVICVIRSVWNCWIQRSSCAPSCATTLTSCARCEQFFSYASYRSVKPCNSVRRNSSQMKRHSRLTVGRSRHIRGCCHEWLSTDVFH